MKMQKVQYFEAIFNEANGGFIPFRQNDELILQRTIRMSVHKWNEGVYLNFEFFENYHSDTNGCQTTRILPKLNYVVYDRPCENRDCQKIPNKEQQVLMQGLFDGDFQGKTLEKVANGLFVNLLVLWAPENNPIDKFLSTKTLCYIGRPE